MEEKISDILCENGFEPQDNVCITLSHKRKNTIFVDVSRVSPSGLICPFPDDEDISRSMDFPDDVVDFIKSQGIYRVISKFD